MKKTLIAVAALAATGAFAQVTIYGALDAGVYSISNGNASATGSTAGSAAAGTQSGSGYADSSVTSSIFGLKSTEDLGGGMSAGFDIQGDIQTNNGGLNQNGIFRRAANVSVAGGFGKVELGLKGNPLIATNAQLASLGGNSVMTNTASTLGYADFYTKNAITYTTPNLMGFTGVLQYGMANNLNSTADGSVTAYSGTYVNGPLTILAAAQDRKEAAFNTANSGANPSGAAAAANATGAAGTGNFVATNAAVTGEAFAKQTQIVGAKYQIGSWNVSGAYLINKAATSLGGALVQKNATLLGASYQVNPKTVVGATVVSGESSRLVNAQARYSLSARTTLYTQFGQSTNDVNGTLKFAPIATNTGSAPAVDIGNFGGAANVTQSAIGVGVIHTF